MKKKDTIIIDFKQLQIDELRDRIDKLCDAINSLVEAHNSGKKIVVVDDTE